MCCRGRRASRRRPLCRRRAPRRSGRRAPSAFPRAIRSGWRPSAVPWKGRPVRPSPHCTSSQMSSAPVRLHPHESRRRRLRKRPHPAFALDRLHDDGGGPVGDGGGDRGRIRRVDERDAGHQRAEGRAVMIVPGDRDRAHRASVERVRQRDEVRPRRAEGVPVASRELEARLHRFGSAVAEERARETREIREPRCDLSLQGVVKQVRRVQQRRGLVGDRVGQAGMPVAERGDADAGNQVEIALARRA